MYNSIYKIFVCFALVLISLIIIGVFFALIILVDFHDNIQYVTWMMISYIAGLSMIILPCTMPLVFIIVPLSMGHCYKKGLTMSILFGLGLTITITVYGTIIAKIGDIIALNTISTTMFLIAGTIAFLFGLNQINLIHINLPSYSGMPKFIQTRGDFGKSFFMGLLLGNAGVGCPNPMFYWLLTYIASTGNLEVGSTLGFIHGIGRAIPLILISLITIIGINVKGALIKKRRTIEHMTGFMLIFIGSLLIINGLPGGHMWYEETIIHTIWNNTIEVFFSSYSEVMINHTHSHNSDGSIIDSVYLSLLFSCMVLSPICFMALKKYKRLINGDIK